MQRGFLRVAGFAAAIGIVASSGAARAEYPDRPIRVVLGFPAGGGADIQGRWFVEKMKDLSGATIILENKPGNSGNIAADSVAKSKPDGYTLMLAASASMGASRFLYKEIPYDSQKDFAPVTTTNQLCFALTVSPKTPVNNVAELTAHLKAKNGKATYGWAVTSAIASAVLYVASENIPITQVAYKQTGQAVSDVAAGEIDFAFADMVYALGQARQNRIKILAVTCDRRTASAPEIPTMAESGVPAATTAPWWGLWAPAATPQPIVDKLEGWLNQVVAMPETKQFLLTQGADPLPGNQKMMREMLAQSIESWRKVISIAKIDPQ